MKKFRIIAFCRERMLLISMVVLFFSCSITLSAQELPPRPITVNVNMSQNLAFGAFYHYNTGGTVTINSTGSRSSTGDVVLLNLGFPYSTGLYDLVGNPGTLISILKGPDAVLPGSNGGSMTLQIGDTDPVSPFIITIMPPAVTQLRIGGILNVGNPIANPPGNYSGTFDITFVQE